MDQIPGPCATTSTYVVQDAIMVGVPTVEGPPDGVSLVIPAEGAPRAVEGIRPLRRGGSQPPVTLATGVGTVQLEENLLEVTPFVGHPWTVTRGRIASVSVGEDSMVVAVDTKGRNPFAGDGTLVRVYAISDSVRTGSRMVDELVDAVPFGQGTALIDVGGESTLMGVAP